MSEVLIDLVSGTLDLFMLGLTCVAIIPMSLAAVVKRIIRFQPAQGNDKIRSAFVKLSSLIQRLMVLPSQDDLDKRKMIAHLEQENFAWKQRLEKMNQENQEHLRRLSEVMSDRLRYNNPQIADLSDSDRPVKLGERFSELYDNEWTDAFESLGNNRENLAREGILLTIVMEIFKTCRQFSRDQKRSLEETFKSGGSKPIEQMAKMHQYRKIIYTGLTEYAVKFLTSHIKSFAQKQPWRNKVDFNMASIKTYVNGCSELCWLMTLHEPPVHLSDSVPRNRRFDKDLFKEYTRSGQRVSEVIWPVAYLHEGGPLLSKGVAQGC